MQLGRYRLDEQVGQGGMAVVWRGFDTQLRRIVAVKVLHPHLHAREDIRRRFDREAQAVARLHHPHILDVYDFSGLEAEPSYLVTEFIRGGTLRQFAEEHAFDPPELAAACLLPIAEALEHAHAAGVVHRDLKPENVMVREDGVVKLTDFGIAALVGPDEKFTLTGSILGSPAHLAPETIEGKPAEPRSDLFSFGTIFYWLSCGELPFRAPSPAALLRSILDGQLKDPRIVRPAVSDAQSRIILRCLERDPAKRYQSAAELRAELEKLLADSGVEEPLEVLARFVRTPADEAPRVRETLVARCLARGERELRKKHTSAALAAFGRVLALQPDNAQAKGRVDRIRRRARLLKLGRRALLFGAAGGVAAALAFPAIRLTDRWRDRWDAERRAARAATSGSTSTPTPTSSTPTSTPTPTSTSTSTPNSTSTTNSTSTPTTNAPTASRQPPAASRKSPSKTLAQPTRVARVEPPTLLPVTLALKGVSAQVMVDDRDLGYNRVFHVDLTPGKHRLMVHHTCCADLNTEIEISPNVQRYPLPLGPARPARIRVIGADPDAQVWVSDENTAPTLLGSVRDLNGPSAPQISMIAPDHRFTITVGDQHVDRVLQAGRINEIDMAGVP